MQPKNLKKPRWSYLFFRCYCLAVLVFWNGYGLYELFTDRLEPSFTYLELLVIPAILLCFNLLAFPFRYSVFGAFKRTPWPDEPPLCSRRSTYGRVCLMSATVPFFNWHAFPSGLGFSIVGVGKGFIPYSHITGIKEPSFFSAGFKLTHTWPEVRSPVVLSSKKVVEVAREKAAVSRNSDQAANG
jgi:hypothetical protein